MPVTSLRFFAQFLAWVSVLTLRSLSVQLPILTEHSFLEFTAASCDRKVCVACGSVQKKKPRRESTEQVNQGFNQIRKDHLRKRFRKVREDEKIGVCLHSDTQGGGERDRWGCYLSFTSLSWAGSRGLRFIMSDSDRSYASEIAGTYKTGGTQRPFLFFWSLESFLGRKSPTNREAKETCMCTPSKSRGRFSPGRQAKYLHSNLGCGNTPELNITLSMNFLYPALHIMPLFSCTASSMCDVAS